MQPTALMISRTPRLMPDVGPTNENQKIPINLDEEQIASGCCARRGCLHHVGVHVARMGTLGQRRVVACLVAWPGQFAALSRW